MPNLLEFYREEAINEACKDLKMCYKKVLIKGPTILNTALEKSIALSPLSMHIGLPRNKAAPIVIATVLKFIKKNPYTYDLIELFVQKNMDFEMYKKLLLEYYTSIQKARLVYYKDDNYADNFALLPRELHNIILLLMMNAKNVRICQK